MNFNLVRDSLRRLDPWHNRDSEEKLDPWHNSPSLSEVLWSTIQGDLPQPWLCGHRKNDTLKKVGKREAATHITLTLCYLCFFFQGGQEVQVAIRAEFRAAETWGCKKNYRVFRCKKECWTVVKWCCPLRHSPKQQSWCRKRMINHWISWIQGVPGYPIFGQIPSRRTLTGGICWNMLESMHATPRGRVVPQLRRRNVPPQLLWDSPEAWPLWVVRAPWPQPCPTITSTSPPIWKIPPCETSRTNRLIDGL
jgi:hypothetical protein